MAEPFPSSALAAPRAPTSVHDLKTLVLSRHPAIAIESSEEERVEQLVHAVASLLQAMQEKRDLDTGLLVAEATATVPLSVSRCEDIERLRAHARERFAPVR